MTELPNMPLIEELDNNIKRTSFYSNYRKYFENRLSQPQVNGYEAIFDAFDTWEDYCLKDPAPYNRIDVLDRQLAYILATAYGEVGKDMQPVREGFKETDWEAREHVKWLADNADIYWVTKDYGKPHPKTGKSYFGRGWVQLTHYDNYLRMSLLLFGDDRLVWKPELALQADIAAKILIVGMAKGIFTGRNLFRYINSQETDYYHARRIINGMDRSEKFARYARKFESCIELNGEKITNEAN